MLVMTSEVSVRAILATRGLALRVIVSERIHPPMLRLGRVWHLLRKRLYRYADEVIVQTEESRNWIERHARGSRTRVIPNPVILPLPSNPPKIVPPRFADTGRRLLLAVGRLDSQKGFDRLIEAFAILKSKQPAWDLVIVGEGNERGALEASIAHHALAGRVQLPGHSGNPADWYRAADLFVLSSRYEGFPNVLAEAMAHGCAVVACDCPTGPRDIVLDGIDGLLVQIRNATDPQVIARLADALGTLMSDDVRRSLMAAQATRIAGRYAPESIIDRWQEALVGSATPQRAA